MNLIGEPVSPVHAPVKRRALTGADAGHWRVITACGIQVLVRPSRPGDVNDHGAAIPSGRTIVVRPAVRLAASETEVTCGHCRSYVRPKGVPKPPGESDVHLSRRARARARQQALAVAQAQIDELRAQRLKARHAPTAIIRPTSYGIRVCNGCLEHVECVHHAPGSDTYYCVPCTRDRGQSSDFQPGVSL